MRLSTQPSVCSMTSSSTSAQAWRELTDISRPRVRVCRAREAGEGEVVAILLMEAEVEGPDLLEVVEEEQEGLRWSALTY